MTWSYRVMRDDDVAHRIAEIYGRYPNYMWTADPIAPHGDTLDELRTDLERMRFALLQPVLDESELRATVASAKG